MANYTHLNMREVEDSAPSFGFAPDLQARFASRELGLERSGCGLMRLAPNARAPFGHAHREQEELYVVVDGSGRIKIDEEIVELRQWDAVRLPAGVTRAVEAGPDGIEYLAFGAPAVEAPKDEAEIKPNWWSD